MENIVLPRRLLSPFPSRISAHVQLAERHTIDWIKRFGLLQNDIKIENYRSQGYAFMVGRMFPDASPETLCAYSDLNTLLFLVDDFLDQHDQTVQGGNSTAALQKFIFSFNAILEDPEKWRSGEMPVLDAMAELWQRLRKMGTSSWILKYKESLRIIFKAAMWQHHNIEAGIWPALADYMDRRQYIGAANVATDCIEMIYHIELPDSIWKSWWLVGLTELCRNTVCWANDLFSHGKERAMGEYHNLVSLISHHKDVSEEKAIALAIDIHDAQVESFIKIRDGRPIIASQYENAVSTYINVLEAIMRGNIDWSDAETTRYTYSYEKSLLIPGELESISLHI